MNRNRFASIAIAGLAATALLGACAQQPQSGGGENSDTDNVATGCPVDVDESLTSTARIAFQYIPNGDLVVKDLGWLESCAPNATIEWVNYASGADVVQAFGSDSADIGLAGSGPVARMLAEPLNLDVKVVWIHDVIGAAESLVTQEVLSSVADLAGATIAVPFGSTAHYSLLAALEEEGLTSADANLINLAPDAMLAAWERGEIDAAWIWDPTLSELLKDGHLLLTAAETAEAGRPTFDLGVASTSFVEANPEFMDLWTKLQSEAARVLNEDPDAGAESLAVVLSLSVDEAKAQMAGLQYLTASEQLDDAFFGGDLGQAILSTGAFLESQGLIDGLGDEARFLSSPWSTAIENAAK